MKIGKPTPWGRIVLGLMVLSCVCNPATAQTDTTRVAHADTVVYGTEQLSTAWRWVSKHVGGDLFLNPEYYGLHVAGGGPLTWDVGPGAELRIRPIFVGCIAGWCGNDGIPSLDTYSSFYLGMMVREWRIELGQIGAAGHDDKGETIGAYVADFFGVSRRFGRGFFFEPEVKIVYPIVSHYWNYLPGNYTNGSSGYFTQQYHPRDLYFAIGLKLGLGVN